MLFNVTNELSSLPIHLRETSISSFESADSTPLCRQLQQTPIAQLAPLPTINELYSSVSIKA